jgi:hypothetical protein
MKTKPFVLPVVIFLFMSQGSFAAHPAAVTRGVDFQILSRALSSLELKQSLSQIRLLKFYRFASLTAARQTGQNLNLSEDLREYQVRLTQNFEPSDVHQILPQLCLNVLLNEGTGAVALIDANSQVTFWQDCPGE